MSDIIEGILSIIFIGIVVIALLIVGVIVALLVGAFIGYIISFTPFCDWILNTFASFGVNGLDIVQLCSTLAFISLFFAVPAGMSNIKN